MRIRVAVLIAVATLLVGACGNASNHGSDAGSTTPGATVATKINQADLTVHHPITETGVTDSDIRVSVVASITNPLGADYRPFGDGINAYFAMVNDGGGIYGRKLKVVKVRDDQLANDSTQVQAAISEDNPFAVFVATSLFSGANKLAAAKVPTFGWNINAEWAGHPTFFQSAAVACFTCARPILPWLAKQIGATKIGVLAYNVPQSADCATGNENSFKKYPTGQIVFLDKTLNFGVNDVSAQVNEMKRRGVQLVLTCIDFNGAYTVAKEMKKDGLNAVQVLPNAYNPAFMKANGSYFEGDYVTPIFTALEHQPQIPEAQTFLTWINKTKKTVTELSIQGWIAADQFVTGLKLAGPDFNRAKVVAALNAQKDFTANGFLQPIDWSAGHTDPSKRVNDTNGLDCWNWVKVHASAFVSQFSQAGKPWLCFTVASEKRADPSPMALPAVQNQSFAGTGL